MAISTSAWRLLAVVACAMAISTAAAQETGVATRQALIEQEQAAKEPELHPYVPNRVEQTLNRFEYVLTNGGRSWHPFFDSAYPGGGFTLGMGYTHYVSAYSSLDVRGSDTIAGYKRIEAEFLAPRMFHRRGTLSVLGGWREATEVGFYGIGLQTSKDDRTNFAFGQP
jgi:hypothetical protein